MRPPAGVQPARRSMHVGQTTATTAFVLLSAFAAPRAPPPRLCAPLTIDAYGLAALHVDLEGTRSVRRLSAMPERPDGCTRIVFVSDTHAQFGELKLPDGDVLVHTGDITFCARGGLKTLREFNTQLASLPHRHKIVIGGNHDKRLEQLGRFEVRTPILSS